MDEGEPSSSVTITAQVKNVKGISKEQISRTLIVKGADTGDDGDDNNGGGSDDGSGSGSGDGIDDGTDSSGGDDNGYTAEELKAAISDKEDDIAQAKEDLHDAQISYKEAKAEAVKEQTPGTGDDKRTLAWLLMFVIGGAGVIVFGKKNKFKDKI